MTSLRMFSALLTASAISAPAAAQIRVDAPIHSSYGSCPSCDLSNKRLNGMKLENANFAKSLFNNSNLSGGVFLRADLTQAHFRKALLYGFEGNAVKMTDAVLEDATLTEASVTYSVLQRSNLRRANLTRANFSHNDFRAADLSDSQAVSFNATGSNFEGAKLDDSNLQDANLSGASFKQASFGKAILLGSQMQGANLSGADLSSAQGLTQGQLDLTCGDANTLLPDGLFLPFCGEAETILTEAISRPDIIQVQTPRRSEVQQNRHKQDSGRSQNSPNAFDNALILGLDQKP